MPEISTLTWPRFIVSPYNVLAIKLTYDTYLGTVKWLSQAMLCLSMYFLGNALVIGLPLFFFFFLLFRAVPVAYGSSQARG